MIKCPGSDLYDFYRFKIFRNLISRSKTSATLTIQELLPKYHKYHHTWSYS